MSGSTNGNSSNEIKSVHIKNYVACAVRQWHKRIRNRNVNEHNKDNLQSRNTKMEVFQVFEKEKPKQE